MLRQAKRSTYIKVTLLSETRFDGPKVPLILSLSKDARHIVASACVTEGQPL